MAPMVITTKEIEMKYTEEKMKATLDEIAALKSYLKREALAIAKERHRRMGRVAIKLYDLECAYVIMCEKNNREN